MASAAATKACAREWPAETDALRKVTGVTCIIGAVRLTALATGLRSIRQPKAEILSEIRRRAVAFPRSAATRLQPERLPRRRRTSRADLRSVSHPDSPARLQ